jgi:hypothetical protein
MSSRARQVAELGKQHGQSSRAGNDAGFPLQRDWTKLAERIGETTPTEDRLYADAFWVGWASGRPAQRSSFERRAAELRSAVEAAS